jgi:Family of unknown function (DUF5670)
MATVPFSYKLGFVLNASTGKAVPIQSSEVRTMRFGPFMGLAILLLVLWACGFLMFHVAGGLIHLLLLFAVIALVVHLFTGARTA